MNSSGPPSRRALQRRQRDDVVVQVRGDRQAWQLRAELDAVGGRGDEARDADELLVELVVERLRGGAERLQRAQRRRHLGAVGVVLRRVDARARRQQHDERRDDREGRADRDGERHAQARPGATARGEGDEQAERERGQPGDAIARRR